MMRNKIRFGMLFGGLTLLMACVTVNVYFPAKELEKRAGDIIDDIRRDQPVPPALSAPQSFLRLFPAGWSFTGTAWAQKELETPAVTALKNQIRDRFPRLAPLYQKGAIGENNQGWLELRDLNNLSPAEKNEIKPLVDSENRDRRALYQEVAKSMNIPPDQLIKVQRIFAEKWQQSASPGWWIQKGDGSWIQKKP
jgi:uncharacterized protein YdbL (DUF1318 family)